MTVLWFSTDCLMPIVIIYEHSEVQTTDFEYFFFVSLWMMKYHAGLYVRHLHVVIDTIHFLWINFVEL